VGGISAIELAGQALVFGEVRQRVLASDIANANTPGFTAKDVTFAASLRAALGQAPGANPLAPVEVAAPGLMTNNGNGVDLEAALVALEENALHTQGLAMALTDTWASLHTDVTTLAGA
jgi:flagellar basal body rod protein FlgB